MWFFRSPTVVFGEDAVLHIRELRGKRAFVVSDKTLNQNGLLAPVLFQLEHAGMQVKIFDDVEPEPALSTVEAGADLCGSCSDVCRCGPELRLRRRQGFVR